MRLIENENTRGCSPSEMIILVRHGVDVSALSQDLNQPLVEETKSDVRTLGKQMIRFCGKVGVTRVRIGHSNRLRAIQTAAITAEEFFAAHIPTEMYETAGVREIYQGEFIIKDSVCGAVYKPLSDAWSVWQQKLDECELLYRFGDPSFDGGGKARYPELVGRFTKFGEHQGEFSLRLYLLLEELFRKTDSDLQVIVGHQASCSRIQRIFSAASKLKSAEDVAPGQFVRFLEKAGARKTIEPACGIVVKKPDRNLILTVLRMEIEFLKSIVQRGP